ncbi:MAG TPA: Holliday junction resolvase RuvX [Candidatus Paceibacterota bacterium]|jgi:putative transcription antitermination factor YqgF|nr:Holliday junction resolvase RuvX [Candidatus Paceibacterota bacterium]
MKYLGIDYGGKRVGTAVSNHEGTIAFPRDTLANDGNLLANIARIVQEEKIEKVVIGDTRSHGGGENPITAEAETFMAALAQAAKVPVSRAFEVFSSIEASRYAPETKQHDDAAAAAVILQRFLDMNVTR